MKTNFDVGPAPNSVIHILQNVPLDNTYRNTIDWASFEGTQIQDTVQESYFLQKKKFSVTDASYQRINRFIAVKINAEQLMDCNYIMFKNPTFNDNWYYAFITQIEYKNDTVSYIYFEIDVFQTYYKKIVWLPSFIEREHVEDDAIGKNLVPEDLDTGEIIYYNQQTIEEFEDLTAVICTTAEKNENVTGGVYNGIYSGSKMYGFPLNDPEDPFNHNIENFLHELDENGKGGGVSNIFLFPSEFIAIDNVKGNHELYKGNTKKSVLKNINLNLDDLDGYVPKNKKMFGYPYNMLKVTNMNGTSALYDPNYMHPNDIKNKIMPFFFEGAISTSATIFCVPQDYKNQTENFDNYIVLNGYPTCNWTYGVFDNWYAQNSAAWQYSNLKGGLTAIGGVVGAVSGAVGGALTAGVGGAILGGVHGAGGIMSGLDTIAQNMIDKYQHQIEPNQSKGGSGGMGANVAMGIQNFFFYSMGITAEYAKRIDRYLSAYGYKVNEFKIPNLKSRKNWNFIKTVDCNIEESIPVPYLDKLKQIFNNGITIWHDVQVGVYGDYSNPIK